MASFLLSALQTLLAAQATIVGTVRHDETGQPLAGATVTVTELSRVAITESDGQYTLRGIPAGQHHIAVRMIGYADRLLQAIVPPEGTLEINLSLHSEPVRLPNIEIVGTQEGAGHVPAAFPDQVSRMSATWTNPMLSEPDALAALGGRGITMAPEAPSGLHIRGGASDQTAYLLDGIPVFSPYHAAGVFSAWNPDALSEVRATSAAGGGEYSEGLSGVVSAATRNPGPRTTTRGGASTTQARFTMDGPLGNSGAGYMVSIRSGIPSGIAREGEGSYLQGATSDWLAKLELPAFGGRLRLVGYDSENGFNTAATAEGEIGKGGLTRNRFSWRSRSVGAEWNGVVGVTGLRVRAWSANSGAGSEWSAVAAPLDLNAQRHDLGLLAMIEKASARTSSSVGVRLERSSTSYLIESDSGPASNWSLGAVTPVAALFAEHHRAIGHQVDLTLGASLATPGHDAYLSPSIQLRWTPVASFSITGSVARRHQFAQSLRNPESVVGTVFPVDLYAGAGAPGVPVARSDQSVVSLEYRPSPALRIGVQAYDRRSAGLVIVAPGESEPFSTSGFDIGSGHARGAVLETGLVTGPLALAASYGYQRVRLEYGNSSYVPEYAAAHLLDGGVTVFPTATTSFRIGVTSMFGRRTTPIAGGLEWESCNLLDRGCEFGGSPHYAGGSLGARSLPAYFRVDLGLRKQWRFRVAGRMTSVAAFGTVTNLFNRVNVLTYASDPSTGRPMNVEMRPLAPLVVGFDFQY